MREEPLHRGRRLFEQPLVLMRYRIAPRVVWQLLGEEAVLVDLDGGGALGLNESASFLWSRADGGDAAGLAGELAEEFGLEPEQAALDVGRFLGTMQERGFLEGVEAESAGA